MGGNKYKQALADFVYNAIKMLEPRFQTRNRETWIRAIAKIGSYKQVFDRQPKRKISLMPVMCTLLRSAWGIRRRYPSKWEPYPSI